MLKNKAMRRTGGTKPHDFYFLNLFKKLLTFHRVEKVSSLVVTVTEKFSGETLLPSSSVIEAPIRTDDVVPTL
jgi:hypothetical protein